MLNQKLIFVFLFTSITNASALFYFLKDYGHQHSHEEVDHHNYHPHHHHDEHKHHEHKHHDQKHQNHKYQGQDHKQQEYKYHEHKYPQEQQQMHKHHEYDYHYYHHPHGYEQQKHHQNHKHHEDHKTHDEHKQHTNHKSHEDHKHHEEHKHNAMKPNKHDHKNHEHKQHEYDHKHHEHKHHEHDHKHHEHKHHEHDHKHHEHKHHEHDHKHHEHKHHEYDHKHHEHKHHEHDHKHSYHDHKYHEHKHPEHYQHHSHQGQPHYEFKYGVRDPSTGDIKNQWEVRKGDDVQGEYSLVEADGTIRTVQYKAGKHTGFNAIVKKEGKAKHPATGESRGHRNFVPQKQPDRGLKPPQQEPVRDVYEFKPKTGDIFAEGDTARLHYFSAPEIPANHKPIFTGIDEETNLLALYKNYPVYNMHGQEEHGFDYGIREYLSKRSYDLSKITELLNENSSSPSVNPLKAVRGRFVMGR